MARLPQEKALHDELPFAAREWSTASAARYFMISGFWTGPDFDDVAEGTAISAFEERHTPRSMARRTPHQHSPPRP